MAFAESSKTGTEAQTHGLAESPVSFGLFRESFKIHGGAMVVGLLLRGVRSGTSGAGETNRHHRGNDKPGEHENNPHDIAPARECSVELSGDPTERSTERTNPVTDPRQYAAKGLRRLLDLKPTVVEDRGCGPTRFVGRDRPLAGCSEERVHGASDDASTSRSKPSLRTRSSR